MMKPLSLLCLSLALLQACSSGSSKDDEGPAGTVSISGTLTGLTGEITLSINGNQETLSTNGDFKTATRVNDNENYQIVVVNTQDNLSCTVTNDSGVANGNITDVLIECNGTDFTAYNLNALAFNVEQPSIVTVAFHLIDRYTNVALDNLDSDNITSHIEVLENDMPVSPSESFLEVDKFGQFNANYTTVFAIDISSSLRTSELDSVVSAIRNLIVDSETGESKLLANQFISILTFDGTVTPLVQKKRDPQVILAALDQVKVGGNSTNLFGALKDGSELWENTISLDQISYGSLILFTDGNDTSGSTSKTDALSATADKDVFFIAVGSESDTSILEEFTPQSNIFTLDSFEQMEQKLDSAIAQIKTYENGLYILSYATPKRAGEHKLTLNAIDDYNCDFAVTDSETSTISNTGQLSNCHDSQEFEFNADGFTDVSAELDLTGATVIMTTEVEWRAKLRWSRDEPSFNWDIKTCDGQVETQLSEDKKSVLFTRTSAGRAILEIDVFDDVTGTSDKKRLLMASNEKDLDIQNALGSICNR